MKETNFKNDVDEQGKSFTIADSWGSLLKVVPILS